MGVLRKSGSTRLSRPGFETPGAPSNEFLDAVREAAAAEQFEILGEIGQGKDLSIVYLARDLTDRRLVALRLEPGAGDEYLLEVVQQLDSSIPSVEGGLSQVRRAPSGVGTVLHAGRRGSLGGCRPSAGAGMWWASWASETMCGRDSRSVKQR